MLVIRLQRTGRKNQPSYRMVVAEKSRPVKKKHIEVVGSYNPSEGKKITFKKDRIDYWISVGAQPSDTVAGLLKFNGMKDMEKYMKPRNKKRPVKNPSEEELAAMEAANAPTEDKSAEENSADEETSS